METGLAHELGVEGCHDQVPLLQDDRALLVFGEHARRPSPISSTIGARMNTPRTGCSMPRTSRSASNESTWRP